MKCEKCGHKKSIVINTRIKRDHQYRRRKCERCGHRWSTYEMDKRELIELAMYRKMIAKQMESYIEPQSNHEGDSIGASGRRADC